MQEAVELQRRRGQLRLVADCWNLLEGRREHYLPRGEREPEAAYRRRVEAALPSGFFRDALRTFAGMLSRENWTALPIGLELVLSDVDGRGTDLGAFLAAADVLVLRDGGCLLLVLPPDHLWPSEGDRQQALRRGDRLSLPRLQLIPRTDLLNWQLPHSHGLPVRLTWREAIPGSEPLPVDAAGHWSEQPCPWLYRSLQLKAQGVALSTETLVADPQSPTGWRVDQLEKQLYQGLQQLPALWYSSDGAGFGEGELPHLGLAHQYLNQFRCQSDYQELLSRCALPVGVRTGVVGGVGQPPGSEPVVLGPNTVMDLPEGASFQFAEVQARSLAEHRAWLEVLDTGMRRDALIPSSSGGVARTAMEISLAASQSYALLQSQAIQKASLFSSLLVHWCAITGEPLSPQAALQVSVNPLTPPVAPRPTVSEWLLLEEKGVVSRDELRQLLELATPVQVSQSVTSGAELLLAADPP